MWVFEHGLRVFVVNIESLGSPCFSGLIQVSKLGFSNNTAGLLLLTANS